MPHGLADQPAQRGELLERAPERGAGSRRRFEEHHDRAGTAVRQRVYAVGISLHARIAVVDVVPGMRDEKPMPSALHRPSSAQNDASDRASSAGSGEARLIR